MLRLLHCFSASYCRYSAVLGVLAVLTVLIFALPPMYTDQMWSFVLQLVVLAALCVVELGRLDARIVGKLMRSFDFWFLCVYLIVFCAANVYIASKAFYMVDAISMGAADQRQDYFGFMLYTIAYHSVFFMGNLWTFLVDGAITVGRRGKLFIIGFAVLNQIRLFVFDLVAINGQYTFYRNVQLLGNDARTMVKGYLFSILVFQLRILRSVVFSPTRLNLLKVGVCIHTDTVGAVGERVTSLSTEAVSESPSPASAAFDNRD